MSLDPKIREAVDQARFQLQRAAKDYHAALIVCVAYVHDGDQDGPMKVCFSPSASSTFDDPEGVILFVLEGLPELFEHHRGKPFSSRTDGDA